MAKKESRRELTIELVILIILIIISFVLWDTQIVYPIKLFVVILHEVSHAIVTILSGGKIVSMNIGFDLSGKCVAEGGSAILIASAGYLGSLIWGLLFFIAPNNKKNGKWLIIFICCLILITSVAISGSTIFILIASLLSILLITASFFLKIPIVTILIKAFGLLSCIYVMIDIKEDIFSKTNFISDASILSHLLNVPAILIGLIWIMISILGIIFVVRRSYLK